MAPLIGCREAPTGFNSSFFKALVSSSISRKTRESARIYWIQIFKSWNLKVHLSEIQLSKKDANLIFHDVISPKQNWGFFG